jgi:hypothetical protein
MIKAKLKTCSGCGQEKPIWKNFEGERFCKTCWSVKTPAKFPKQSKALKPVSDKRKPLDQLYSKLRKEFLELPENFSCRAKLPGCMRTTGQDLTIHHTKGRGKYYLQTDTWIPLCLACHHWVEEHPLMAKELMLSQSRI